MVRWDPEVATFKTKTQTFPGLYIKIGWQKFDLWGPGNLVVNINISLLYSYTVVCAKMLKGTKKKALGFVVIIFIIGGISISIDEVG